MKKPPGGPDPRTQNPPLCHFLPCYEYIFKKKFQMFEK